MKIQPDVTRALYSDTVAPVKQSGAVSPTKSTNATPAVGSVNISEASRSLLAAGVRNVEAPFDAKRVEAIKAAISSGQFKVDPEAIADRVLASASQLLTRKA